MKIFNFEIAESTFYDFTEGILLSAVLTSRTWLSFLKTVGKINFDKDIVSAPLIMFYSNFVSEKDFETNVH